MEKGMGQWKLNKLKSSSKIALNELVKNLNLFDIIVKIQKGHFALIQPSKTEK